MSPEYSILWSNYPPQVKVACFNSIAADIEGESCATAWEWVESSDMELIVVCMV